MIKSVSIKNLRGIRSGEIDDLAPLSIFVGPNGSGKSTVLDALLIGGSPAPADAIRRVALRRRDILYGARWLIGRAETNKSAEICVEPDLTRDRRCLKMTLKPTPNEAKQLFDCEVHENNADTGQMSLLGTFPLDVGLSYSEYYEYNDILLTPLSGVSEIRLIDPSLSGPQELSTPIHQLYTKVVQSGRRSQAREILRAVIPNLEEIEILTELNTPIVHLVYEDYSVPAAIAGDGIGSLLRLCLELASRPSGVVLLEEPEVHQHLGALRQSARCMWAAVRRDIQVILTTHSLELIDCLISEASDDAELEKLAIYRTQLDGGELTSFRSSGIDAAFVRSAIHEDLR